MRSITLPILLSLILVLSGHVLSAQGTIGYSHSTAGDLTQRFATGGGERTIQTTISNDSILPKEQILERLCFQSDQTEKRDYTPSRIFNADSIAQRRSRILAKLQSRAQNEADVEVDTSLALGQIPVSSTVTQTGARSYSVPVPTAAGSTFAPEISLDYNSQGGEGDAGYGWNLSGVSSITIRNKSFYYDSITRPARYYDASQRYSLDGIPLVPKSISGHVFYDFETTSGNILVKKIKNSLGGVVGFTVLYPNGDSAVFGFPDDSVVSSVYPITEISDCDGHSIKYTYYNFGHPLYYVHTIAYGHNYQDTILFSYLPTDTLNLQPYFGCQPVGRYLLLSTISSYSNGGLLSRDILHYSSAYGTSLLNSIERIRETERLNPLRFEYGRYELDGEDYTDNAPECDSVVQVGSFSLTSAFQGNNLLYVRGKLTAGNYDDGLIVLPNRSTYYPVDTSWFNTHHYDSQYDSDQQIMVYPNVATETPDTLSLITMSGFKGIQAIDINGDGTDEIVSVNARLVGTDTRVYVHHYSLIQPSAPGGQWSFVHGCDSVVFDDSYLDFTYRSPVDVKVHYGDFTGCGKIQVLLVDPLNGDARILEYSNGIDTASVVFSGRLYDPSTEGEIFLCQDLDSDGLTDICLVDNSGSFRRKYIGSSSTSFTAQTIYNLNPDFFFNCKAVGDLNGDGYLDIVYTSQNSSGLYCALFSGSGFTQYTLMTNQSLLAGNEYLVMDVNKDGYGDIIIASNHSLRFYINNNGSFSSVPSYSIIKDRYINVVPNNIVFPGGASCILAVDGFEVTGYKYATDRSKLRLMSRFIDCSGNEREDVYVNISENNESFFMDSFSYTPSSGYCLLRFPLSVLSESYSSPYRHNQHSEATGYYYQNSVVHQKGLGFCGFQNTAVISYLDPEIGIKPIYSETTYDAENSSVPVATIRRIDGPTGQVLDSTVSRYAKVFHRYRKYVPRLDTTIRVDPVSGFRTMDRFQYDSLEFVSQQYHVCQALATADTIPGAYSEKWTGIQYAHQINLSDGLWLLGNAASVTEDVTDMQHLPLLQYWETIVRKSYSQGSNRPDTVRTFVGMTDQIEGPVEAENLLSEVHYTYDSHGNITSKQSASYGGTAFRGSTYTYDAQGRFLLSETDAAGQTTSYSGYNLFGKPTTVTDPRENVTSYTYDNWGNLTSVTYPDGHTENTSRQWAVDEDLGSLYKVTVSGNASPTQTTWYSSLGQELRTGTKRFNGDIIYTDRQYSNSGRLLRESLPYKTPVDSILWNTTSYDTLGRISSVTAASGAVTSYAYNGRTTGTTKEGITITKTVGADGNVYFSQDPGGDIRYFYRPDGQPDSVRVMVAGTESSPVWATTRFTYDAYGRRTSVIDPSAGTRSDAYTDNADGSSSVVHTTANGTITTSRDYLGRVTLVQRHDNGSIPVPEEPEERARRINDTLVASTATAGRNPSSDRSAYFNTTYTYNSYGDLVSAVSNNGTSTYYTYDTYGRIATQRENIPGSQWLQRSFSYDTAGRVASTVYTTGSGISVTESYAYTNGYHTATTAMNSTVWQLQGENALGQPTLAYTGSAIRRYGYDAYGFPVRRELESAEGATTMDFRYGYDHPTGNMTWREDATREATEEDFVRESFTYDGLNRLTSMGDNLLPDPRDVTYTNSGNVTSVDGNGDFYYPNNQSSHPYRISGGDIGELAWCQDPNISLGYTAYDRPMYITGATGQVEFTYNDAGERVSAISSTYVGGEQTYVTNWCRYYIGGQYEREVIDNTTRETLWLGGDAYSAPMIFYRENNTGGALYNIGRDVQGSITHLASADGTLLQEFSYDPWGRQRNPGTHAFATYGPLPSGEEPEEDSRTTTTVTIPVLHRGYCGHEHLEQFGLINMNARLYDPFTGRFYSPDPYVQMPDFSQSFNRYAYCLNNPLKYTDESGHFITWSLGAAGFSVGINFTPLHIPIGFGINIGWSDGLSFGMYGEYGFRIACFGTSASYSLDYNFSRHKISRSVSIAANVSLGILSASFSRYYSQKRFGWQVGLGFGTGNAFSGESLVVGYGSSGLSIGISGYYNQRATCLFRLGISEVGIDAHDPLQTTDDVLKKMQLVWFPDAPMESIVNFSVEHLSLKAIEYFEKYSAFGLTDPVFNGNELTGKSSVYFSTNAFSSAKQLFLTMGHEFVHVSNYITAASFGLKKADVFSKAYYEMTEFQAYSFQASMGGNNWDSFDKTLLAIADQKYGLSNYLYQSMPWYLTINRHIQ